MNMIYENALKLIIFLTSTTRVSALIKGIDPANPPYETMPGQYGYNQCGAGASPNSKCQNVYIKSAMDFCLFGPPMLARVSETERDAVSYCTQPTHGARLIPPGTFSSLHYVSTPHYVQITGRGNFTKINVPANDDGGEMGYWDARGNPIGGVVFGNGNQFVQWTEFLLPDEFCIRACYNGPDAWRYCNHVYDLMACRWNIPGDYGPGFDSCEGKDVPRPMGEYKLANGSILTWHQDDGNPPPPGLPGILTSCTNEMEQHITTR
ncbi:hypothetical protein PSTG_09826 [Puccinia striiformis f. sp. tritici PST-78]|uniref:Carbohydrate-binding module family 13 protein n=1 Tax=Puccinia striiformis f. sp. tritici PST-78 TaxID=1165861 RepID=A0A0L0VC45_9BASI|nr:hypothetical protein PSTG_09826 [Puccinia striiformis f. sp. tritici PST-78]